MSKFSMSKNKSNKCHLVFRSNCFANLFFVVLLLSFSNIETKKNQKHLEGVIIFNQQNFDKALQDFQILIVSFQEQVCQFCSQFKLTYAMIAEKYNQNLVSQKQKQRRFSRQKIQLPVVQFGKLKFNQETSHIFQLYKIEVVPSVRIFLNGKLLNYQFQSLDYGDQIIEDFIEWIVRSLTQIHQIQQIESLPSIQISIIINCDSDYIHIFNQVRNKQINYNFFCSHQRSITAKTQISIYQKNTKINSISLLKDPQNAIKTQDKQNKQNLQTHLDQFHFQYKLQSFFNKKIHLWNNDMAHDIFSKNKSAFILILNNQTRSQKALQYYLKIKDQFNQNNKIPSVKFIATNLAYTPQQTTKIKRYLLGLGTAGFKKYPYPILAYVRMGEYYRVSKYIFTYDMKHQIVLQQMKNWMLRIVHKLELKQQEIINPQLTKTPTPIQQWFINLSESVFKQQLTHKSIQPNNSVRVISHKDFKLLLTSKNSTQPFLVYFSWRNDFQIVTLEEQIRQWWINQEQQKNQQQQQNQNQNQEAHQLQQKKSENKYSKILNLYVFNLNFNDYPNFQNLQVKYLPSLFYFSKDKKIEKLHGITRGIEQVKEFIQKHVHLHQNQKVSFKQQKAESQGITIKQTQQQKDQMLQNKQQKFVNTQLNKDQIEDRQMLINQVKNQFANQVKPQVVNQVKPQFVDQIKLQVVDQVKPLPVDQTKPQVVNQVKPQFVDQTKPQVFNQNKHDNQNHNFKAFEGQEQKINEDQGENIHQNKQKENKVNQINVQKTNNEQLQSKEVRMILQQNQNSIQQTQLLGQTTISFSQIKEIDQVVLTQKQSQNIQIQKQELIKLQQTENNQLDQINENKNQENNEYKDQENNENHDNTENNHNTDNNENKKNKNFNVLS